MDQPIIVDAREVLRLGRFRKIWLLGWLVATLALVFATVQTLRVEAHQRTLADVMSIQMQQRSLQEDQRQINASYLKAWEQQQETAKLLTSWGQFVVEKTDMINQNRKNPPLNFVRKQ